MADQQPGAASRARRHLRAAPADRRRRHRLSSLQHRQAARRLRPGRTCSTARRSARRWRCCSPACSAVCAERVRDNAPGATPTVFGLPAGRALAALARRRAARHGRRGGAAAFPRRLSTTRPCSCRSPCRRSPPRCSADAALGARRPRPLVHALVAAPDRAARLRRRRLPRLSASRATWAAGATGARTC